MEVKFKLMKLENIDPFSTSPPFLRFTCLSTGWTRDSKPGIPNNGTNGFEFDELDPQNTLIFDTDEWSLQDGIDFDARLMTEVKKGDPVYYKGLASIHLDATELTVEHVVCTYYEHGNWKYECGTLTYSFEICNKGET